MFLTNFWYVFIFISIVGNLWRDSGQTIYSAKRRMKYVNGKNGLTTSSKPRKTSGAGNSAEMCASFLTGNSTSASSGCSGTAWDEEPWTSCQPQEWKVNFQVFTQSSCLRTRASSEHSKSCDSWGNVGGIEKCACANIVCLSQAKSKAK